MLSFRKLALCSNFFPSYDKQKQPRFLFVVFHSISFQMSITLNYYNFLFRSRAFCVFPHSARALDDEK